MPASQPKTGTRPGRKTGTQALRTTSPAHEAARKTKPTSSAAVVDITPTAHFQIKVSTMRKTTKTKAPKVRAKTAPAKAAPKAKPQQSAFKVMVIDPTDLMADVLEDSWTIGHMRDSKIGAEAVVDEPLETLKCTDDVRPDVNNAQDRLRRTLRRKAA